jgi:hypothetical protein
MKSFRFLLLLCGLAGAALLPASSAQAGFVAGFAGDNARFNQPDQIADGAVSYAVYDNVANDIAIDGVSQGSLGGRYVYMYQIVNWDQAQGGEENLLSLDIQVQNSLVQSIGFFDTTSFNESGQGPINGTNPIVNQPLAANYLTDSPGATNPVAFSNAGGEVSWTFAPGLPTTPAAGSWSTVVWFTSDLSPAQFREATLSGATGITTNNLPVPTPLPGGLALLVSGAPGLFGLWVAMRRKNRA